MRKYLKGGYYTIDLANPVYADILLTLEYGKAIMIKDGTETYFADSIAFDDDTEDIIITKGGKTITISTDNSVEETGDLVVEYTAGTNITIEDNVISAKSDALYSHDILIRFSSTAVFRVTLSIINKTSTALDREKLATYLYTNGLTSNTAMLNANGDIKIDNVLYDIIGLYTTSDSQTAIKVVYLDANDDIQSYNWAEVSGVVNDTVVEI